MEESGGAIVVCPPSDNGSHQMLLLQTVNQAALSLLRLSVRLSSTLFLLLLFSSSPLAPQTKSPTVPLPCVGRSFDCCSVVSLDSQTSTL